MKLLESPQIRTAALQRNLILSSAWFRAAEKEKLAYIHVLNLIPSLVAAMEASRCILEEWLVVPDGVTITLSAGSGSLGYFLHAPQLGGGPAGM
jgi:hypothetical protein